MGYYEDDVHLREARAQEYKEVERARPKAKPKIKAPQGGARAGDNEAYNEENGKIAITTLNLTAWPAIGGGTLERIGYPEVVLFQEHKRKGPNEIQNAKDWMAACGYNSCFGECNEGPKGGRSAGVGILWKKAARIQENTVWKDSRTVGINLETNQGE